MILIDTFESIEIEHLIAIAENTSRVSLNSKGFADFMFFAADGHSVQLEHKTINELLSDPSHVETQLRKQYPNAQESMLIIDGVMAPTSKGIAAYSLSKDGKYLYKSRTYNNQSYMGMVSWIWQLDKLGITTIWVVGLDALAKAIVAVYRNSQKTEHQTMNRYIKKKVELEKRDPYVETLMGLPNSKLGEKKAKQLLSYFGTPLQVFLAQAEEIAAVPECGPTTANKIFEDIGRS